MRTLTDDSLRHWFKDEHLFLTAQASLNSIAFFDQQIKQIEKTIKKQVKLKKSFQYLKTVPGIGDILALIIMLEVGDISRFAKVGNFASYCRCVSSKRLSDGKSKGKGNRKNGNKYLSWAFVEATQFTRRHNTRLKRYYDRKAAQRNPIVATKALSNKLARICYYIMRDQVPFQEQMLSG